MTRASIRHGRTGPATACCCHAPKNSTRLGTSARWLEDKAALRVVDETAAIPDPESDEAGLRWSLSGLHAKLYVIERNKEAHVLVGSANTTDAAWGGNDELLVEIVGRVGTYGVDAALDDSPGSAASCCPTSSGTRSRKRSKRNFAERWRTHCES